MVKLVLPFLIAGLALANPTPEILRNSDNEDGIAPKPEVSAEVSRVQSNIAATINTYITLDATVFGQTNYLEEDECYYLPNYVGQVTWVKPAADDKKYQVFFYTSRDCDGPKLVSDTFYYYDIRRRYSVSVEQIDLADDEWPLPPNATVTAAARTGQRGGGLGRRERIH